MPQADATTSTNLARAIAIATAALPVIAAAHSPRAWVPPRRDDRRVHAACATFLSANVLRSACARGEDVAGAPRDYDHVEEAAIDAAWHAALQRVMIATPWTPLGLSEKATALMLALRVVAAPLLLEIDEERDAGRDTVHAA